MTPQELHTSFIDLFTQCVTTLREKSRDYASVDDALENFKIQAASTGLTPFQVWSVFSEKHRSAIVNAIKNNPEFPESHSENLSGRIVDLINYLGLLYCLRSENPNVSVKDLVGTNRPRIVCVCGSTKFKQEWEQVLAYEALSGNAVFSVGLFAHDLGWEPGTVVKSKLDELHLRKIEAADYVWVIDVNGYVGESTSREILHAEKLGLPIKRFSEQDKAIAYVLKQHGVPLESFGLQADEVHNVIADEYQESPESPEP